MGNFIGYTLFSGGIIVALGEIDKIHEGKMARICRNCFQPYRDHSAAHEICPGFSPEYRFVELTGWPLKIFKWLDRLVDGIPAGK